jgi:hypothetical protein
MDLTRLAAKQKRLNSWRDFLESGGAQVLDLRSRTLAALNQYSDLLEKCWEASNSSYTNPINPEHLSQIEDLERQLEELNEEARLSVVGKRN